MTGVVASLLLAAVFLLAGASKVVAGPRWSLDARALGTPAALVPLVPWVEVALGALLAARLAPALVGAVALAVLATFSVLLAARLVQVRSGAPRPTCACFGAWSARPIGWRHLARNAVLAGLAVVVIVT